MKKLIIYSDGASRGNPGAAGVGAVIQTEAGEIVAEISGFLGKATNNVAEYTALIKALEKAISLGAEEIQAYTDSELMVKQIKGEYRVKNEGLKPLYQKTIDLGRQLNSFSVAHIVRGKNKQADRLANKGIDDAQRVD